jgi:hypothetical protein
MNDAQTPWECREQAAKYRLLARNAMAAGDRHNFEEAARLLEYMAKMVRCSS